MFLCFFLIQNFHVEFNELCLCIYIKKTKQKKIKNKKFQDFQIFPKKREKFSKKNLWTRDIGLPIDFFKKRPIFFFQRFQDSLKSSFKLVHEDLLDKTFSKLWCLKA